MPAVLPLFLLFSIPCRISWVFCRCIGTSLAQTTGRERGVGCNMLPWKEACPHGWAHLRGQSNETLSPESYTIRFSAHTWLWWQSWLLLGAALQSMQCHTTVNGLDTAVMTAGSLWECCSTRRIHPELLILFLPGLYEQAAFRAGEHLIMARAVLMKKTENFGIWNITKFSQLKSFLGITIATSVCNELHIFVWLLDSSLADTNMNSPLFVICCPIHAEWDLLLVSLKMTLRGSFSQGRSQGVFSSLLSRSGPGLWLGCLWLVSAGSWILTVLEESFITEERSIWMWQLGL